MATATWRGRRVKLGGARKIAGVTPYPKKVSHFWRDPQTGNIRVTHAGDVRYSDFRKHKNKKRRANFRSRHNCSEAKPHSARWVACKYLW